MIRALLRFSDGLTTPQIRDSLGISGDRGLSVVTMALRAMPDAYIDRWERTDKGQCAAVWCVIEKPEDCPKPNDKLKEPA